MEGLVSEETGVVDEDINSSEGLDGFVDDPLGVEDRVVVGDSSATGLTDLFDDQIGRADREVTSAGGLGGRVIDNDLGSSTGELEGIGSSETIT